MTKPAHRGSPIGQLKIIIDTRIPPGRELLVFHRVGMPKCAAAVRRRPPPRRSHAPAGVPPTRPGPNARPNQAGYGRSTGYAPADFILALRQQDATPGAEVRGVAEQWRDGFLVLDKCQATRKLTINLGLRSELAKCPTR